MGKFEEIQIPNQDFQDEDFHDFQDKFDEIQIYRIKIFKLKFVENVSFE